MQHQLRIGVDCRLAGHHHAGIGRYVENLILRLPSLGKEVQWVFFFFDQAQANEIFQTGQLPENVEIVFAPIRHYSVAEQLKMPRIFGKARLDALHVPHFNIPVLYGGKMLVTIHDLLWHEYKGTHVTTLPSWQYFLKHSAYQWVVRQAVTRAKKIFVPANTVKNAVTKLFPSAAKKIQVTKEGISNTFLHAKKLPPTTSKTLVYVGSLYPHKNIKVVLDALATASALRGYSLSIVGSRNVFQEKVKSYVELKGLKQRVKFLGYLSDAELMQLYAQSFALVQPSLSEGFGLTGVEAMAAGLPVLASDIPIFHEIYLTDAVFFDPHDSKAFAAAVEKLAKRDRKKIIQAAKQSVKQYDWQSMAEQTYTGYRSVLS